MTKDEVRKAAAALRARAHAAGQGAAAVHLAQLLGTLGDGVLAGYMPMRSESDPLPAMAAHAGPVCVPVIEGRGLPLRFREWEEDAPLEPGMFGAMIPTGGEWLVPDLVIVPLLAFDARGYRLGYGGGFYDRTLQALRAARPTVAIGFAFAAQELAEVPTEPTDQRLDWIVTERGARRFG